jgi:hypothetical protein
MLELLLVFAGLLAGGILLLVLGFKLLGMLIVLPIKLGAAVIKILIGALVLIPIVIIVLVLCGVLLPVFLVIGIPLLLLLALPIAILVGLVKLVV